MANTAIIKNAEVYYVKCDPKRPNNKHNKANPTWEVQIRTTDLAVRDEWKALKLNVRMLTQKDPNEEDEDAPKVPVLTTDGKKIYRVNLKKGSMKKGKNGAAPEPAEPVKVVNGALEEIDPNTIGNGSVCNIRVFQYEYKDDDGKEAVASMLMGMQVVKHIVYIPETRNDFEMQDTEVIHAQDKAKDGEDEDDKPVTPKPAGALPEGRTEDDF